MMDYFTSEKISKRITRIRDLTHTAVYLVEGNERACLIDTGCGIGSLRSYVETLTDKPYFVILTHGHVDHAGGAGEFRDKDVYLHPMDRSLMNVHCTNFFRLDYLAHVNPDAVAEEKDCVPALDSRETLELEDGMDFDLGDLTLQIIHTPGHTQGMCMVLMKEERAILFGDGCGVGVLLLDEYASSVETYRKTLLHLKKYESLYDRILRNHGTCESSMGLLDSVIECTECILNGTDDRQPAVGIPIKMDDAYFAKAIDPKTRSRADGGEGNIAYTPSKIKD